MTITANHVTLFRIASVPLIACSICIGGKIWTTIALVLFVVSALSDWYDGYLARKTGTVSIFGKVFDSIADKLLVTACILALAYSGRMGNALIIPACVILLREIFIAGLREFVVQLRLADDTDETDLQNSTQASLATSQLARIKTVLQMVSLGLLIPSPYLLYPYVGLLGGLLFWGAAALSVYTGWQYWQQSRPSFIKADLMAKH